MNMTGVFWLIERLDKGYPTYWDGWNMTDNIDGAVLFQSKALALRVIANRRGEWGAADVSPTEHSWS